MKLLIVRALILFWILAVTAMSQAASDEDVLVNKGNDSSGGKPSNALGADSQTPLGKISDDTLLRLLENRRDQKKQEDLTDESRDEMNSEGREKNDSRMSNSNAKKPQVLVKAEPGDGQVKLTWKLVNIPAKSNNQDISVKSNNQTLRFSIRYGIESEKLAKTLHVGTSDG